MATANSTIVTPVDEEEQAALAFELAHVPDMLTINERRALFGYPPVEQGNIIVLNGGHLVLNATPAAAVQPLSPTSRVEGAA